MQYANLTAIAVQPSTRQPGVKPARSHIGQQPDSDRLNFLCLSFVIRIEGTRGTAAKQFTAQLVFRKTVLVDTVGHDRYRRSIAQVKLPNGESLNRELVKQGFAWQYSKYSKDAGLQKLEKEARRNRRGLWQAPDTVPPWTFRKIAGRAKLGSTRCIAPQP